MSWLEDKFQKLVLSRAVKKIAEYLDGKKTVIGALSLLLWVAIYAVPAFTPQYNWVTVLATQIRDQLQANGIQLDNSLFNVGTSFTVVGLVDKVRKLLNKDKYDSSRLP